MVLWAVLGLAVMGCRLTLDPVSRTAAAARTAAIGMSTYGWRGLASRAHSDRPHRRPGFLGIWLMPGCRERTSTNQEGWCRQ
ncbi:protein of unknown function [Candidatus Hydrogenisulfobacillus filiaventi]|uniref:Uncharacterized protein n=1 Tax=Candidatus Hydrogenisulfobacillus filiaventi TaxID=2707344 RepID=A0A6F8ZDB7_9FIRM|nr:protein of unknown function [Candidatus Hydrogenisulfobacillus filiaventi]